MKSFVALIVTIYGIIDFQNYNESQNNFNHLLDIYKLGYNTPEGFCPVMPEISHFQAGDKLSYSTIYFIESKEKNILIGFYLMGLDFPRKEGLPDPNMNFLQQIQLMDNYQNGKKIPVENVKFYSANDSNILNAQGAGEYQFGLKVPLLNDYRFCRLRFFIQADYLQAFVFYFYKSENEEETVKKVMTETFEILKFQRGHLKAKSEN